VADDIIMTSNLSCKSWS